MNLGKIASLINRKKSHSNPKIAIDSTSFDLTITLSQGIQRARMIQQGALSWLALGLQKHLVHL